MKNSANKDDLSRFLAKKFIEMHTNPQQILVVTYEHSIISSDPSLQFENDIAQCQSEEADQRVIRHVLNLKATSKYKNILACTYDTDVLMLLISYSHLFSSTSIDLICQFGFGDKKKYYCINTIASSIGPDKCKALPFFHAFSGCDTVSSFYGHSKTKIWDSWFKSSNMEQITNIFTELSNQPKEITSTQIDIIEEFLMSVYYPKSNNLESIDIERFNHFTRLSDPNLRTLPPSRNGLTEHIKRAALQAGWIWAETVTNVEQQNPELWGWKTTKEGRFYPRWYIEGDTTVSVEEVCKICTCQKAFCKNCKCAKDGMKCLPFCKCQKKCEL